MCGRRHGPVADPFSEDNVTVQTKKAGDTKDNVHIRVQQRNGKKSLTTVQGLPEAFDYKKILKALKKGRFCSRHSLANLLFIKKENEWSKDRQALATRKSTWSVLCLISQQLGFCLQSTVATAASWKTKNWEKCCNFKETSVKTYRPFWCRTNWPRRIPSKFTGFDFFFPHPFFWSSKPKNLSFNLPAQTLLLFIRHAVFVAWCKRRVALSTIPI